MRGRDDWKGRPARLSGVNVLALLALGLVLAIAPPAAAAPRGRLPEAPPPADSLHREDHARARLFASDFRTLVLLRRETEYAANQFRRYMGPFPPKIGIAALGAMENPASVNVARLKLDGYEHVLADWPDRPGVARAAPRGGPGQPWEPQASERISRWFLLAFEREQGRGTPAEGRARHVPDWFEIGLAGLATRPTEQNLRLAWMHARMEQRIPIARFLIMTRPTEKPVAGKSSAARPGAGNKGAVGAPPPPQLFDAQSLSFAKFLSMYEHERFLGLMLEKVLVGEPQLSAFGIARNFLPHPDVLEKEWVAWVKDGAKPSATTRGSQD